jgi:hypothetical protein
MNELMIFMDSLLQPEDYESHIREFRFREKYARLGQAAAVSSEARGRLCPFMGSFADLFQALLPHYKEVSRSRSEREVFLTLKALYEIGNEYEGILDSADAIREDTLATYLGVHSLGVRKIRQFVILLNSSKHAHPTSLLSASVRSTPGFELVISAKLILDFVTTADFIAYKQHVLFPSMSQLVTDAERGRHNPFLSKFQEALASVVYPVERHFLAGHPAINAARRTADSWENFQTRKLEFASVPSRARGDELDPAFTAYLRAVQDFSQLFR